MSKVNAKINAVNFSIESELKNYTASKIDKLSVFFEGIVNADVYLKLESENELENKIAEIKLHVPKHDFFAKKNGKSFEEAVDKSCEALRKQLRKLKTKLSSK